MKQTGKRYVCNSILAKYMQIKIAHNDCVIEKIASAILGPSIIRVFKKNTKDDIINVLKRISIDDVKKVMESRNLFKKWFLTTSLKVSKVLQSSNMDAGSKRWAHATKITSIYLRDLICRCARDLTKREYARIEKMLYVPLDKIVLKRLNKLCSTCDHRFKIPKSMSELKEKKQFFHIQDCLYYHASKIGIPAIWFDDIWVTDRDLN
jgi:hypothetical protein